MLVRLPAGASAPDARPAVILVLTFLAVRCITSIVVLQYVGYYISSGPWRLIVLRSLYPIVCVRLCPHVLDRLDRVLKTQNRFRHRGDRTEAITIALLEWIDRQERKALKTGGGP